MNRSDEGFTFVEVVACLLVVAGGLASALSLTVYATVLGSRAQDKSTAMATALSIANDPLPLVHGSGPVQWTGSQPPLAGSRTSEGWINGYYVVRVEQAGSTPLTGFASNPVSVDVYDGVRGEVVASYSTILLRQQSTQ